MPPRGGEKGTKRARQYEHIRDSLLDRGSSEDTAEEIAARTVNKERARSGEGAAPSRPPETAPAARVERGAWRRGGRGVFAAAARAREGARATSSTKRPGTATSRAGRR